MESIEHNGALSAIQSFAKIRRRVYDTLGIDSCLLSIDATCALHLVSNDLDLLCQMILPDSIEKPVRLLAIQSQLALQSGVKLVLQNNLSRFVPSLVYLLSTVLHLCIACTN
jgi:hypothetical protein